MSIMLRNRLSRLRSRFLRRDFFCVIAFCVSYPGLRSRSVGSLPWAIICRPYGAPKWMTESFSKKHSGFMGSRVARQTSSQISFLKSLFQNKERARCPRFGGAARREEGEYPLWIFDRGATQRQRQRSGNPEGCFLVGAWRRCSSVGERCGYPPSSRLASRPPENSAPIPHFVIGSSPDIS
jgi:hypothetical protein